MSEREHTARERTERALEAAVAAGTGRFCPPTLAAAIRYVVFPAGGRIRPMLCFAAAGASVDELPPLVDAAAASVELLHCASLAHDDLPCFDDASLRRGRPSLHRAFSEEIAVLVGDALIVMAFTNITATGGAPERLVAVLQELARGAGSAEGITAGQAWESEGNVDTALYHRLKTGALFEAALVAGALAVGSDGEPWRAVGRCLGEAYQIADDLADHGSLRGLSETGKLAGRDAALSRPNAAQEFGPVEALRRLNGLIEAACDAVPASVRAPQLQAMLRTAGERLVPANLTSIESVPS